MTFGFWRGFYFSQFEELWRTIVRDVYPYIPKKRAKRSVLNTRIENLRRLRNPAAHHEPIFHWSGLSRLHTETHETVGWPSSSALTELAAVDRFRSVLGRGSPPTR